jgi:L-lactate dehydrogenase complex protein LldG
MTCWQDRILAEIRRETVRSQAADAPDPVPSDPAARFHERLRLMGATILAPDGGDPVRALRAHLAPAQRVCSAAPEVAGNVDPAGVGIDEMLDVAVVRAALGVAETGSLLLSRANGGGWSLPYLARNVVALLDPADIVQSSDETRWRVERADGPAGLDGMWVRGPDVRSLTVVMLPRGHSHAD